MWFNLIEIDIESYFKKGIFDLCCIAIKDKFSISLFYMDWGNYYSDSKFYLEIFGKTLIKL